MSSPEPHSSPYSIISKHKELSIAIFLSWGTWHYEICDERRDIYGTWESTSDNPEDAMREAKRKADNWHLVVMENKALYLTIEAESEKEFILNGFSRVLVFGNENKVEKVRKFFEEDKDSHCITDDWRRRGVIKANYRSIGAVAILRQPIPDGVFSGDFDPDLEKIQKKCDEEGISIIILTHSEPRYREE